MTTATATKPAKGTIEFFKAKLEKLRNQHNKLLEQGRKKKWGEIKLLRALKHIGVEKDIVLHEVFIAGLKRHILDRTVTFQSGEGYEGNHELGDALEKQFPQGKNDSESGQGFFYINEYYVDDVLEWLKDKVEIRERVPKYAVDPVAVRTRALGVSQTVCPMLK